LILKSWFQTRGNLFSKLGVLLYLRLNRIALKRLAFTILAFFGVAILLAVAEWAEGVRCAGEEYAVYSAYLSEGLLSDAHDWGVDGPVQVVVKSTTNVSENLRIRALYVFDRRVDFDQLERSTRVSYLVRNIFSTRLTAKFQLPRFATLAFTSRSDYSSPEFQKEFPRNQGVTVLSGVGFNRDRTQAVFYMDHFCGLCGGGRYVLMTKVDGVWHVQDEHSTWSS
jgi:hypothetical protein